MAWGIAVAGASVVQGVLGSRSAKKESAKTRRELEKLRQFYQSIWGEYKTLYGDLEKQYVKESQVGLDPNFWSDRAAADVRSAYDRQIGATTLNLQRYGLDPTEGQYQHIYNKAALDAAKAEAGARTRARMAAGDASLARKRSALDYGAGLRTAAMGGLTGSTMNLANLHSQNAALQGQSSADLIAAGLRLLGKTVGGRTSETPTVATTTPTVSPDSADLDWWHKPTFQGLDSGLIK